MVRRMRANKGWIELANGGNMPAATNAVYAGEDVTTQAGIQYRDSFLAQQQVLQRMTKFLQVVKLQQSLLYL